MKKTDDEAVEVIYDDSDPKWKEALNNLQGWNSDRTKYLGKSDPSLLAELLMGDETVPPLIARVLGTMLAPHARWTGGVIKVNLPPIESVENSRFKLERLAKLKKMDAELKAKGKRKKERIEEISKAFGTQPSTAKRLIEIKGTEMVWEFGVDFTPGLKPKRAKKLTD